MGWVIDAITLAVNAIGGAFKNEASFENKVKTNANNYKSALTNANSLLQKAEGEYNKVRDNITSKYGSSTFALLQKQYNQVNNIGQSAVTRNNLGRYNVDTDVNGNKIGSSKDVRGIKWGGDKSYYNIPTASFDYDSDYEKHNFSSDDTLSIVDQLYNTLSSGNTALAQELRLSGNQISAMLGNAQDEVNQSMATYKNAIGQSALQLHSQNLNNTLEVASARATMASSGIRNTGTGSANQNLAELQADITSAYYAMNIKAQAMQLQNEVYNTQKTASISAYQSRANIEIAQRQAYEDVVSAYGSGAYQTEEYINSAREQVEIANTYKEYGDELQNTKWWDIVTKG